MDDKNMALAILAAALDLESKRDQDGNHVPLGRPSMVDLAIDDYLFVDVPRTEIRRWRIDPAHAIKVLALSTRITMWATAEILGHSVGDVAPREVAERIRHYQRFGLRSEE